MASSYAAVDWKAVNASIHKEWDASVVACMSDYIAVPNQSPHFDAEWATNGLLEKAMDVLVQWLKKQRVQGMQYELLQDEGRTPFLIITVEGTEPTAKTLFMYGHMDKQPPLLPWADGLDPYTPVYRDGKLYGRGGADDGYAVCAAVTSIAALQAHGVPHGRVSIVIEGCEESSSYDLPHYINKCKGRIGDVDLVVCLDSGALNYEQMWLTNSLRGNSSGLLTVEVMRDGIHSGLAGNIVPDSFRILRHLLDRIEDSATGEVKVKEAYANVPEAYLREKMAVIESIDIPSQYPFLPGVSAEKGSNLDLAIRNTWYPCLTVTGDDLPTPQLAGNVIRSKSTAKLSLRTPPGISGVTVSEAMRRMLEADPPYGAKVSFETEGASTGWSAQPLLPWLEAALHAGSQSAFDKPFALQGLGFSIPFMNMLGEMYPSAQFVVTGVLGPLSNAHGPNEFLHVPFAKGITCCVARVVAEHFQNRGAAGPSSAA